MGTEIERKYLVRGTEYRALAPGVACRQGYLCTDPAHVVRLRIIGDRALLTIKGPTEGATRAEFEYAIPLGDARELLAMCEMPLIEKTRYTVPHAGLAWEVDEFHGANAGLVVAECELQAEDQPVDKPEWVGEEVTGDARYFNSSLATRPYTTW